MTADRTRGQASLPVGEGRHRGTLTKTHQLPGKRAEGQPPTTPLIRTITSGGLGQGCRRGHRVSRVWVKAALVGYGMDGQQEKSHHPEWPDHREQARECDPQGNLRWGRGRYAGSDSV